MTRKVTLSKYEIRVLKALQEMAAGDWNEEGSCFYFRTISKYAHMTKHHTRLACRSLARKGLAVYERGLFNSDGEVAGGGYRATEAGLDLGVESEIGVPAEPML